MNEFILCIGHLQGFGFLWWLYLNHGIEKRLGVFCCVYMLAFFLWKIISLGNSQACLASGSLF
jgi:hypothetical protein